MVRRVLRLLFQQATPGLTSLMLLVNMLSLACALDINIGLLATSSDVFSLRDLDTHVEVLKSQQPRLSSVNITLTRLDVDNSDVFLTSKKVRGLSCTALSYIASPSVLLTSIGVSTEAPYLLLKHDVTRESFSSNPNIIHFAVWPKDIFSALLQKFSWKEIIVIFDSSKYDILPDLSLAAFEQKIRVTEFSISDLATEQNVSQLMRSAYNMYTKGTRNFVILCNDTHIDWILRKASIVEEGNRRGLHQSRWIVLGNTASTLPVVKTASLEVDNIIVLLWKDSYSSLTEKLKDVLSSVILAAADRSHDFTNSSAGCLQTNNAALTRVMSDYIHNSTLSTKTRRFDIYSKVWESVGTTLSHLGFYSDEKKLSVEGELYPNAEYGFNNRSFTVGTLPYNKFVIKEIINGTVNYTGLVIDLLKELAVQLNFSYTFLEPEDRQWGAKSNYGNWSGLIGDIIKERTDVVAAPISYTAERDTVVDYAEPFYHEHYQVVLKRPAAKSRKWRVIIEPFRWHVWTCLFVSIPVTGLIVWALTRLSNKALGTGPQDEFHDAQKAIWYVFGAMLTQGGAYTPNTLIGRTVIGFWWATCIVLVATYGGNLIAFLTVSKESLPFNTLEEMAAQEDYTWGTLGGSASIVFLKESSSGVTRDLWAGIKSFEVEDPDVLSIDSLVHKKKVKEGAYAYIVDYTMGKSMIESDEDCRLAALPERMYETPYAFATQQDSTLIRPLRQSIQKMSEGGILKYLIQKWLPSKSHCSAISMPSHKPINLDDTQSAFYVVVGGIFISGVSILVEFVRHRKKQAKVQAEQIKQIQVAPVTDKIEKEVTE